MYNDDNNNNNFFIFIIIKIVSKIYFIKLNQTI